MIEGDRETRNGVFPTGYPTAEQPPLFSTDFLAQDQGFIFQVCNFYNLGNSNPKFIRSTVYAFPQSQDMVKNSYLPISLSITPIAVLHANEVKIIKLNINLNKFRFSLLLLIWEIWVLYDVLVVKLICVHLWNLLTVVENFDVRFVKQLHMVII